MDDPKIRGVGSPDKILVGQVLFQGQAVPPVTDGATEAGDGMGGGNFFNSEMAGQTPFPGFPLGQIKFPDLRSLLA
jgi:hypothetical protein